jgi:hypothetical protein
MSSSRYEITDFEWSIFLPPLPNRPGGDGISVPLRLMAGTSPAMTVAG